MAVAVVTGGAEVDLHELRAFCRDRLAPYKLPTRLVLVPDLPRNAMGKVTKAAVKSLFGVPASGR